MGCLQAGNTLVQAVQAEMEAMQGQIQQALRCACSGVIT